jgi:hypothetical protein
MKERVIFWMRKIVLFAPRFTFTGIIGAVITASALFTTTGLVYNYVNSKVLAIQLGSLVIISLGILLVPMVDIKALIKNSRIIQAVLVFTVLSLISTMLGLDPVLSFFGHLERGTGTFLLLLVIGAAFFANLIAVHYNIVRQAILYPIAITGAFLGMTTWVGFSGLDLQVWQLLGKSSGGGGTLGNSSFTGTVLIMCFFITLYLLFTEKGFEKKIWIALAGFFTLVNPVLISLPIFKPLAGTLFGFIGDARGATGALLVGLIVFIGTYFLGSRNQLIRKIGWVVTGSVIAGIIITIVLLVTPGNKVHNFFIRTKVYKYILSLFLFF